MKYREMIGILNTGYFYRKELEEVREYNKEFNQGYILYRDNIYAEKGKRSNCRKKIEEARMGYEEKSMTMRYWQLSKYIIRSEYADILDERIRQNKIGFVECYRYEKHGVPTVYFLKEKDSDYVKIGFTINTEKRYKVIDPYSPRGVDYILKIDGSEFYEKKLHKRFEKYHVKNEWFKLSGEVLNFVEEVKETYKTVKSRCVDLHYKNLGERLERLFTR